MLHDFSDYELDEKGLLIVTGSTIRAEQMDRPLAYRLQSVIEENMKNIADLGCQVVVLSDLWYLNGQIFRHLPMISIGGPGVNAVSAHLLKQLSSALVVDDTLMIQMDMACEDLRASIWGTNHKCTGKAMELFINQGYLDKFLKAVTARIL